MAALIASEAQAEKKDLGLLTYMASLRTQKAFDIIWQDSLTIQILLNKPVECWKAHMQLLENTLLQVRQGNSFRDQIDQGVGQDKILSTKNYKDYLDLSLKYIQNKQSRKLHLHLLCWNSNMHGRHLALKLITRRSPVLAVYCTSILPARKVYNSPRKNQDHSLQLSRPNPRIPPPVDPW